MPTDAPLRVLVHVASLSGGGAERAAAVLASGLAAAGHRVSLAADLPGGENAGFVHPGVAVVGLGRGHGRAVRALARLLDGGVDAALAVGAAANLKLAAAQALSGARTPILLSYHGRSDVGRGRLGWAGFALAPWLTRRASRTVCVSEALAHHLVADWRVDPARLVTVPNPVPVERARPARSAAELAARPPRILAVGRLAPEKDFPTLLRAVARLPEAVELVILGEGPERARLGALAASLGIAPRVSLPGYAAEPWDAYAGARAFALSSRSEGFGNVAVEALASGLPVAATDCGGPREILEGGRWGRLVPVGDDAALAGALAEALAAPGEPSPRVARAARYGVEAVAAEYAALLRAAAAGRGPHGPTPSRLGRSAPAGARRRAPGSQGVSRLCRIDTPNSVSAPA